MRKIVLFLMVLACVSMWPGGGAMAADVDFGWEPRPEGAIGTTLTCDDTIFTAEKALVLAHIAKYPATGGRNSPPIAFGSSRTVSSLTENTVFCGALVYDLNLDDEFEVFLEERPAKGELDWRPSLYESSPYGSDTDHICNIIKFDSTDVLRCHQKARYTPTSHLETDAVFDGVDSYSYRVEDGKNRSNIATVTIDYKPAKKPIPSDDFVTTHEGIPVIIDVLANDTDPEGGVLSIDSVTTHFNAGSTVISSDNTITYTPGDPRVWGDTDVFTYMVVNDAGRYSIATVTVTIIPEPEPELPNPSPSPPWWKIWK